MEMIDLTCVVFVYRSKVHVPSYVLREAAIQGFSPVLMILIFSYVSKAVRVSQDSRELLVNFHLPHQLSKQQFT